MPNKLSNWSSTMAMAAVVIAACATALFSAIFLDGNYVWSAFAFAMMIGLANVGILFLAIIPAAIAYARTRQRGDRMSLLLSGSSFVVMLVEAVMLNAVLPMRGE